MLELSLNFTTADQVTVSFDDETSEAIAFSSPWTEQHQKDLRWYVETYSTKYMTEVDDRRAEKIAAQLKELTFPVKSKIQQCKLLEALSGKGLRNDSLDRKKNILKPSSRLSFKFQKQRMKGV